MIFGASRVFVNEAESSGFRHELVRAHVQVGDNR